MTLTAPETSTVFVGATQNAKPATEADLKWVKPGDKIIDRKINDSSPDWYRKPEPPPLPKGYLQAHSEPVFMDKTFFHVTGKDRLQRENDYYERVVLADARFCFDAAQKPSISLTDNQNRTVEIPLGDENKQFMQSVVDFQKQIDEAGDTGAGAKERAEIMNKANSARRKAIDGNTLVAGIYKEIGAGTTLNNVAFKVAGRALK